MLTVVLGSGLVLNYAYLYVASRLLAAEAFGIFYTAISLITVLTAPRQILAAFYTRSFSLLLAQRGREAVVFHYRLFLAGLARWGSAALAVLLAGLLLAGYLLESNAQLVSLFIVLVTFSAYLTEATRSAFQGLQAFTWFGAASLAWMALQFGLGTLGLWATGLVWVAMAGMLAAALVVFGVFHKALIRMGGGKGIADGEKETPEWTRLVAFGFSFGVYAALMHADILVGYFILAKQQFGEYSASAILPKSLVAAVMPIMQVTFPLMVNRRAMGLTSPLEAAKGFMLTAALTAVGAAILILGEELWTPAYLGIKNSRSALLNVLALSAVALSLLRVLVLVQLARDREWHPLHLLPPMLGFVAYVMVTQPGEMGLAWGYTVFCWALTLYYGGITGLSFIRRPAPATRPN